MRGMGTSKGCWVQKPREGWGCGGASSLHGLFPKLLCCP